MGNELKLHASLEMERRKETYKLCVIYQSCNAATVVEHTWYHGDSVGTRTQVEYITEGRNHISYSMLYALLQNVLAAVSLCWI